MFSSMGSKHPERFLSLPALLLSVLCMITSVIAQQQPPSDQGRKPLPKPPMGSRGFEKYTGKDALSRLIAAGATREVVTPRKPLAPLEGRAYSDRPFFAWQASFGSKSYHFVLYKGDMYVDRPAKIVYEKDVAATELNYPADAPALAPGQLYSWRVSTVSASGKDVGPSVTFRVLSGAEAAEVKQAIEQAQLTAPKTTADHLDLARVFENYGVWYDALRLANEMAAQNPNDADAQAYYDALLSNLDEKPKS
jgi:hypothetical protein